MKAAAFIFHREELRIEIREKNKKEINQILNEETKIVLNLMEIDTCIEWAFQDKRLNSC